MKTNFKVTGLFHIFDSHYNPIDLNFHLNKVFEGESISQVREKALAHIRRRKNRKYGKLSSYEEIAFVIRQYHKTLPKTRKELANKKGKQLPLF